MGEMGTGIHLCFFYSGEMGFEATGMEMEL